VFKNFEFIFFLPTLINTILSYAVFLVDYFLSNAPISDSLSNAPISDSLSNAPISDSFPLT